MVSRLILLLAAANFALATCGVPQPDRAPNRAQTPAEPKPETCWEKVDAPEPGATTNRETPAQPAQSDLVETRNITRFETPCPNDMPSDFIASLQRALSARDLYSGAITGKMDASTRAAVRRYQKPEGIDSGTLSLAAARKLGLIAVERSVL